MAERYLLPPGLGGGECELVWRKGVDDDGVEVSKVAVTVDGRRAELVLPSSSLTPVDPLPPEPLAEDSVVWVVGDPARDTRYFVRGSGWWHEIGVGSGFTWAEVCATCAPGQAPVRLIPEPTAEDLAEWLAANAVHEGYERDMAAALLAWLRGDR